ncbi:hypothetical protein [Tenacibaculum jejuense]|uniref:Uncharacterized protein n=1 Tax=Tenacibaculum jejuense TaxID=584609 RepID=A0A238UF53_9FLAO|nr:hypothetical protein [Tenacibaculum jejuense]SNR17685.1 membrane protein of unknown function [Tenacibaculum jejuense]
MKGKEAIINFIVIVALLGYIVSSVLLFIEAFEVKENNELKANPALMYIASALTGLVGGIVAAAFGVKSNDDTENENLENKPKSSGNTKMKRMGEFAMTASDEKLKEKLGNLYAWAYILIGLASIVVWAILNTDATQSITNAATTFVGMMLAIVGAFFKE